MRAILALGVLALLSFALGDLPAAPGETSVERVGKAVSGAVESLSKKILNATDTDDTSTDTNSGDSNNAESANDSQNDRHDEPPSEGRAALDDARRQAGFAQPNDDEGAQQQQQPPDAAKTPSHVGPVAISCLGVCSELTDLLVTAIEGPSCRSLFVNGKCPTACMQDITSVTGNDTWPACQLACEGDVVVGATERWAALCGSRQETLIDQGKEAVKTLVGEGLTGRLQRSVVLQFLLGVLILVAGVGYGYRRGAGAAQLSYRLQKRRLIGRKNSDANLPV